MDTLNSLISQFGGWLMTVLPLSPFAEFFQTWQPPEWLGWLNWFFPVGDCITVLGAWLAAVALYYLYSIIMRWIKVIS